jgi:hypothetical protein
MELTLTSDERELLLEVLEGRQRELLREIARANHYQFEIALKNNERLLENLLGKLRSMQMAEIRVVPV